eukprot:tig00020902_g15011.t1
MKVPLAQYILLGIGSGMFVGFGGTSALMVSYGWSTANMAGDSPAAPAWAPAFRRYPSLRSAEGHAVPPKPRHKGQRWRLLWGGLRACSITFCTNFLGCVAHAYFICYLGNLFGAEPWKFIIATFAMSSYEHVVANFYFLPLGYWLGAKVTVGELFKNWFMALCGNYVGGGLFVGAYYYFAIAHPFGKSKDDKIFYLYFWTYICVSPWESKAPSPAELERGGAGGGAGGSASTSTDSAAVVVSPTYAALPGSMGTASAVAVPVISVHGGRHGHGHGHRS